MTIHLKHDSRTIWERKLFSVIIMLHISPSVNDTSISSVDGSILELFIKGKFAFSDTKERVMEININDGLFGKYTIEQNIKSMEVIIDYCYFNVIDKLNLVFIIEYVQCLLEWTRYFNLGILYDSLVELMQPTLMMSPVKPTVPATPVLPLL